MRRQLWFLEPNPSQCPNEDGGWSLFTHESTRVDIVMSGELSSYKMGSVEQSDSLKRLAHLNSSNTLPEAGFKATDQTTTRIISYRRSISHWPLFAMERMDRNSYLMSGSETVGDLAGGLPARSTSAPPNQSGELITSEEGRNTANVAAAIPAATTLSQGSEWTDSDFASFIRASPENEGRTPYMGSTNPTTFHLPFGCLAGGQPDSVPGE